MIHSKPQHILSLHWKSMPAQVYSNIWQCLHQMPPKQPSTNWTKAIPTQVLSCLVYFADSAWVSVGLRNFVLFAVNFAFQSVAITCPNNCGCVKSNIWSWPMMHCICDFKVAIMSRSNVSHYLPVLVVLSVHNLSSWYGQSPQLPIPVWMFHMHVLSRTDHIPLSHDLPAQGLQLSWWYPKMEWGAPHGHIPSRVRICGIGMPRIKLRYRGIW